MPACPAGHESALSDFCDTCGIRMEGSGLALAASGGTGPTDASAGAAVGAVATLAEPCPQCGTGRTGKFCETCGFNFSTGTPATNTARASAAPTPAATSSGPTQSDTSSAPISEPAWTAIVTADRAYFDAVMAASGPDAGGIEFPANCPERRFRLSGDQMRIGRRSASRGIEPDIDLTGPPTDPGISHLHAVLTAQADGTWSVLDPGSSNGTQVNDAAIGADVPIPLKDGDRICLGAWTVLTLRRSTPHGATPSVRSPDGSAS